MFTSSFLHLKAIVCAHAGWACGTNGFIAIIDAVIFKANSDVFIVTNDKIGIVESDEGLKF